MVGERRTEQVRVDAGSVVVDEDVVEATLWVLDALMLDPHGHVPAARVIWSVTS